MDKQLYYEDIEVGAEISPLIKNTTTQQLVKWAGASEDFDQAHYDKDYAIGRGLPGVIVHGRLKAAFLTQMLSDWIGNEGIIRKISVQYRALDFPGQKIICRGKIVSKFVENGEHCLNCEIWTENEKGEKTTPGTARVILPCR